MNAVKEDEYCEVLWEDIDKIGSCHEFMVVASLRNSRPAWSAEG